MILQIGWGGRLISHKQWSNLMNKKPSCFTPSKGYQSCLSKRRKKSPCSISTVKIFQTKGSFLIGKNVTQRNPKQPVKNGMFGDFQPLPKDLESLKLTGFGGFSAAINDLEKKDLLHHILVGGFNPFEKYACQIGSFPQTNRGENKK